jgi:hypothetical protein
LSWPNTKPEFPIVTTALLLGASFDPEADYHHNVLLEQWNMAYDQGDNNDGITIIDITNLSHPRYAFVFFTDDSFRRMPLTAEEYLYHYEKEEREQSDCEDDFEETIEPEKLSEEHVAERLEMLRKTSPQDPRLFLVDLPLIDEQALQSTWPDPKWESRETAGLPQVCHGDHVDDEPDHIDASKLRVDPSLFLRALFADPGTYPLRQIFSYLGGKPYEGRTAIKQLVHISIYQELDKPEIPWMDRPRRNR